MDFRWFNYRRALDAFELKDYRTAARLLEEIVAEHPDAIEPRLLLARSYYHSASLQPAVDQLRVIVEADPTETYARLLLARTLERQSKHEEAAPHRKLVAALTGDDSLLQHHRPGQ
ncbi:tetratricopeptide repeat protein [Naumannella halotolerans]|uniref:Tetratricopeptide repeat protein n=1 Tax=Naumannella halotolerans TaxID=993414 RepID=A0A4R7J7U3_9ACTN|nr:tetratricopeptide repeat protein [Naumannella halotolerans]TDT33325.1 tetratricopeptide repeat protein [Naumannella halotolerans]